MTYVRTEKQRERITKLIEALESGKYTKARSTLRTDHGMCCLGVACDVTMEETGGTWEKYMGGWYFILPGGSIEKYIDRKYTGELEARDVSPFRVSEMFGLSYEGNDPNAPNNVSALTTLNDKNMNADWSKSGVIEKLTELRDEPATETVR